METVENLNDLLSLKENFVEISANSSFKLQKSKIIFNGRGNVLKINGNVTLVNSVLDYRNNNSLIYLNDDVYHPYMLKLRIHNDSVLYFGKGSYFNNVVSMSIDEMKNVLIGKDCLFSFGIWLRTGDPHVIYDAISYKRRNHSKSIYIGDHVWIGQNAMILKGTTIGSGSIIGANSVLSAKCGSNQAWGGNPAKLIQKEVFYINKAVHEWTEKEQQEYELYEKDDYIYSYSEDDNIDFDELDGMLEKKAVSEKISILESINESKNRFFRG